MLRIAGKRLARHVPGRYAVKENRCPLLDNGFSYHGVIGVSGTTQTRTVVMEPLQAVISIRCSDDLCKTERLPEPLDGK
jgi:hypothetical protein